MKPLSTGLCTLAVLLLFSSHPPVQAQTTADAAKASRPFTYDAADEVTLTATVSSVLTKASPGMMAGSHLLLTTPSGPIDASLGRFGLRGNAFISPGQQIEATGVLRLMPVSDRQVFIVRTLKVDGEVYSVRNSHGVPLSPQAHERTGQKTGQKGESL
jgi:hypothetical protein